ncbi:hypothetical protein PG999_012594 [Apiospora kogelbergensis]|uniref:Uncharacterized protein n=1 Tax=Apiospora kogelbergensis TaxID=1337665 RepID=A0AAW0Q7A9_9PEZI
MTHRIAGPKSVPQIDAIHGGAAATSKILAGLVFMLCIQAGSPYKEPERVDANKEAREISLLLASTQVRRNGTGAQEPIPSNIIVAGSFATCRQYMKYTCALCGRAWHNGTACAADPDLEKLLK